MAACASALAGHPLVSSSSFLGLAGGQPRFSPDMWDWAPSLESGALPVLALFLFFLLSSPLVHFSSHRRGESGSAFAYLSCFMTFMMFP